MFSVLVWGTVFSLIIWIGTLSAGVAVAVISQANTHEISLLFSLANVAAPFLGGFAAGWMVRKRGWVHGGWVGVLYTIIVALVGAAAFGGLVLFNVSQLALNFCLGCIGGICGVNMGLSYSRSKSRKKPLDL